MVYLCAFPQHDPGKMGSNFSFPHIPRFTRPLGYSMHMEYIFSKMVWDIVLGHGKASLPTISLSRRGKRGVPFFPCRFSFYFLPGMQEKAVVFQDVSPMGGSGVEKSQFFFRFLLSPGAARGGVTSFPYRLSFCFLPGMHGKAVVFQDVFPMGGPGGRKKANSFFVFLLSPGAARRGVTSFPYRFSFYFLPGMQGKAMVFQDVFPMGSPGGRKKPILFSFFALSRCGKGDQAFGGPLLLRL